MNNDDVRRIIGVPYSTARMHSAYVPSSFSNHYDQVLVDDRLVGLSTYTAYTANNGCYVSLGIVNEADATDGAQVIIVWGEPEDAVQKPLLQPHVQTEIRATLRTVSPAA